MRPLYPIPRSVPKSVLFPQKHHRRMRASTVFMAELPGVVFPPTGNKTLTPPTITLHTGYCSYNNRLLQV